MTQFVSSHDGVPIAYDTGGDGKPALIMIHGWSCDRTYWAAQVGPLSESFQVIGVDLGGHGESGSGRRPWTVDSFGRDVAAVVEAVDPEEIVLVGHSMGGTVAIAAALHLGERVKGVVWVDTYKRLGSTRSREEIQKVLAPFRANFRDATDAYVRGMFPPGADETLVRRVAEDMAAAPPSIAVEALEQSMTYGRTVTAQLNVLEAPIIAINGEQPPTDMPSMREHGVQVVTMAGVGHFPMMEAEGPFNHLLTVVVSGLSAPK